MTDWPGFDLRSAPAVLVTVAQTEGSCPRETGARMLVTANEQCDTIGGGHLEWQACEIARDMLREQTPAPRLERFALGPSLGQCCGGVVHLAFEHVDASPTGLDRLRRLVQASMVDWPHLVLFGAGHVGTAIIRALADLPCRVTWVDEREDLFPAAIPANVQIEATDTPEYIADHAPAGACFLVLTHSHALDLRLCEHILRRTEADTGGWFGLIGSLTKRKLFERRLAERGIAAQRIADMACPIGLPGITGKAPAVIAASVAAQLLQVWEAEAQTEAHATAHMQRNTQERTEKRIEKSESSS